MDDNDGYSKTTGSLVKIQPYAKTHFSHENLYLGLYCWKDSSLNLGISFGTDYFNKGQLMTKDHDSKNMSIKGKIEMKQ